MARFLSELHVKQHPSAALNPGLFRMLGIMCIKGEGVDKDLSKAIEFLTAALNGVKELESVDHQPEIKPELLRELGSKISAELETAKSAYEMQKLFADLGLPLITRSPLQSATIASAAPTGASVVSGVRQERPAPRLL